MSKSDSLVSFLAGLGFGAVGAVAAVLLAPDAGRNARHRVSDIARRTADAIQTQAENVGDAAEDLIQQGRSTWTRQENKRSETMSDLKDKAKEKIDAAAEAAKKATEIVMDKSRDAVHSAREKLEEGSKRLQDV